MQEHALSPTGRFGRILLATDGSKYSDGAIRVARAMAVKCDSLLTVLSIGIVDPAYSTLVPNLQREAVAMAQCSIDAAKSAMPEIDVQTAIRVGSDPADEIVATAEKIRADVIVMGRHGRRGLARWKLGHATAKVVGHAPCPVLVVPEEANLWQRRILVATDGSRYGELAVVAAGQLAEACRLPLTVMSATLPSSHGPERRQVARDAVYAAVSDLGRTGIDVRGIVAEGRPDRAIVESAERDGADLIIMGSHGRTGMERMLMGSVSEKVLNQAECAVLVVKG